MGAITIYAIKSAICLALLYLPYTLLMRRDTFHAFNRVLLLSIVVLSLVLPLFKPLSFLPQGEMIPNPIESLEKNLQHSLTYRVESEEELTLTNNTPSPNLTQGGETIRMETTIVTSPSGEVERGAGEPIWPTILVLIYIIGVVVCIAWKAFQLVRLYRYIPSNCLWKDTIDGIQVYAHFDDVCPFSWMNTVVITDEDFKNNLSVMQHERAHIRLHHSWDNLFVSFVEVLQWFNPCIWMLDYSLREVHEYEADASVLSHGVTLQNYQSLLIRKAMGTSSYAFANGFNHSLLKKRIKMMMKKKSNRWSSTKALYLLPVAAIALAAFATPEFTEKANAVSESGPFISSLKEDVQLSPFNGEGAEEPSSIEEQPIEAPVNVAPEIEEIPDIKPGDTITGTVVDENGVPIQMVSIEEFDENWKYFGATVTDINGRFSYKIRDLAHFLRITTSRFESLKLKATCPTLNVVLKPEPGRTTPPVIATGVVTDEEGKPLIFATIIARDENDGLVGLVQPDKNGHFSLRAINPAPVHTMIVNCVNHITQTINWTNEPMKIVLKKDPAYEEQLKNNDTNSTPKLDPRAVEKDMSEFLKLSSYDFTKMTYDDQCIIQRALTRMASSKISKTVDGKMVIDKNAKASDINIDEELFKFIKDASEEGYSVPETSE